MSQVKNKPAHEIRLGTIKATIWKQEKDGFTRYNINFSRSYLVEGQWKTSDSYGRDDLPRVIKCADLAYEWIFQQSGIAATDQESAQAEAA
ncbi:MAG: hypothetical protein V4689_12890 [Verrucomicrobiota bacterium]